MATCIYSPAEVSAIIKASNSWADLDELKSYLFDNAPEFIKEFGADEYYIITAKMRHKKLLIYRQNKI